MRLTIIISIFCLSFPVSAAQGEALKSVSQLQWSNRVLLIFGDDDYAPQLNAQLDGINDRHIKWFLFNKEEVISNHADGVSKDFVSDARSHSKIDGSVMILIGKDGGVKSRQADFDLPLIFDLIDSMPMRLDEMRRLEND